MREMLFAFTILLTLNSCSTFKSGLTIPANQTFLLGEFNNKNYSAELVNKSNLTVIVKAVVKKTGEVTQSFGLAPKGRTKVYISKDETVYFENENGTKTSLEIALIFHSMSIIWIQTQTTTHDSRAKMKRRLVISN